MPKRRLGWHLAPYFLLLASAATLGVGWIALRQFELALLDASRADLQARADFLDLQIGQSIDDNPTTFTRLARDYATTSGIRLALILPDGRVEYDSRQRPNDLQDEIGRPEIQQALTGQAADAIRYSAGLDQRFLSLAVPIHRHDQVLGVLYLSTPLSGIDQAMLRAQWWTAIVGALAVALALPLAWRSARTITEPLEQLRTAASTLAEGNGLPRVGIPDSRELAELAEAFNRMSDRLQQRLNVLARHNNEQKAVFASMAEGVLAVDGQERVISLNRASSQLLGLDQAQVQGRPLQEVVRNADLNRFISRALSCPEPIEADVLLHGDRQRVMQARGSALQDLEGRPIGAVVVLNDVTDFRRLDHIRRDFVANVSHELKTPVTSIKGFVETLLDGAMRDPVDAERFLRIIAKQADRLHAIIEDLLSLSKIEQGEDHDAIALEARPVKAVLESAVSACQSQAAERQIEVSLTCDPQWIAKVNVVLLEQAVVNLLDNAIKYSEPGRDVKISAVANDDEIAIRVADRGSGIAGEHLARIFERFYRVDRARSRKMGGTGLGLAIVKHIAQAHHGRVSVDSTLGVGSTFTITLPRA